MSRENYEQSEIKITLKALAIAEESYYQQYKKYSTQYEELGVDFSKIVNISIHFTAESLPNDVELVNDDMPYVQKDSYRVIALFKTSSGQMQVWKLDKGNKIELLKKL